MKKHLAVPSKSIEVCPLGRADSMEFMDNDNDLRDLIRDDSRGMKKIPEAKRRRRRSISMHSASSKGKRRPPPLSTTGTTVLKLDTKMIAQAQREEYIRKEESSASSQHSAYNGTASHNSDDITEESGKHLKKPRN